jgi:ribosomal protein L4
MKQINTDGLFEAYRELYANDPEMLNMFLAEEGIGAEKIDEGVIAIRQLMFKQQAAANKVAKTSLYEKALELVNDNLERSREVILALLETKNASYAFRNLEKLDTADLEQILNESEVLELMEKLAEK